MDAALLLVLASLGAGVLGRRLGVLERADAGALNRFVIGVCLPAVVLRLVPKLAWQSGLWVLVATP